jgi:hypothetical protein
MFLKAEKISEVKSSFLILVHLTCLVLLMAFSSLSQGLSLEENSGIQKRGMVVKIYSVDATINPNHSPDLVINVRPGDQVRLAADLYDQDSADMRQGVHNFTWSDGNPKDKILFRRTPDGVLFRVPEFMGEYLAITASSQSPNIRSEENSYDSITLKNLNY